VERLANGVLMQSAELRNVSKALEATAGAQRDLHAAINAVKREVHDASGTHESVLRSINHQLGTISERLAVVAKDVDDAEKAANRAAQEAFATREDTGAHRLAVVEDHKVGLLKAFGALPNRTQAMIVLVLITFAVGGGLGHWLLSLIGK
jgi:hypothetical protein